MQIQQVKEKVNTQHGLGSAASMILIHGGKILDDKSTIASLTLKAEDPLVIVFAKVHVSDGAISYRPLPAKLPVHVLVSAWSSIVSKMEQRRAQVQVALD